MELFKKKELEKTNQKEFRIEKLIERRVKLYVNNSFNSCIDKNVIV